MEILHEDNNLLVINKPAGISVHRDGKVDEHTIAEMVLEHAPALIDVGEPLRIEHKGFLIEIPKPGIVHRIDKDTSGVLVIAKTNEMFYELKDQFMNRTVSKTYHALVHGWPKEQHGTILEPIGRSRSDVRKWACGRSARGELREASTEYTVLARYSSEDREDKGSGSTEIDTCSYLEIHPKTGRTHQIRVHMKYINHPLVCDELYAPDKPHHLGFERLALHARNITITSQTGEQMTFEAPFPSDFAKARQILALD